MLLPQQSHRLLAQLCGEGGQTLAGPCLPPPTQGPSNDICSGSEPQKVWRNGGGRYHTGPLCARPFGPPALPPFIHVKDSKITSQTGLGLPRDHFIVPFPLFTKEVCASRLQGGKTGKKGVVHPIQCEAGSTRVRCPEANILFLVISFVPQGISCQSEPSALLSVWQSLSLVPSLLSDLLGRPTCS